MTAAVFLVTDLLFKAALDRDRHRPSPPASSRVVWFVLPLSAAGERTSRGVSPRRIVASRRGVDVPARDDADELARPGTCAGQRGGDGERPGTLGDHARPLGEQPDGARRSRRARPCRRPPAAAAPAPTSRGSDDLRARAVDERRAEPGRLARLAGLERGARRRRRSPARPRRPASRAAAPASALAMPVKRPPPPHGTSTASTSGRSSASSSPIVPLPAITRSSWTGCTKSPSTSS